MKKTALLGIFLLLLSGYISINAQDYSAEKLYRIDFKDKQLRAEQVTDWTDFLSEESIQRRKNANIAFDNKDIAVNKFYLEQLSALGGELKSVSRWLNMAIMAFDAEEVEKVNELSFVKDITDLGSINLINNSSGKAFFEAESYSEEVDMKAANNQTKSRSFNYGQSANQIEMLKGHLLHDSGYTGEGMIIAVIDAGFWHADQMDAFDSLWMNDRILGTKDFVEPGNDVFNDNISNHGMMVLSTMGGNLPGSLVGTAPHASYYLLRSEDATAEYLLEEYYWVEAAEYADAIGADIINSSLGYTTFDDPSQNHVYEDMDGNTTPISIAADIAASKGILVVNSAGNSGDDSWYYIGAPADGDSVFSIGAVKSDGSIADFSSRGPTADGRIKPDVVAQGQSSIVASPWGGVLAGDGTSFASPILAGMAACLWQAHYTKVNNMELLQAIKQSADRYENPDNDYGYGIPDFQLAHEMLGALSLHEHSFDYSLEIYPNPFSSELKIKLMDYDGKFDIRVFNANGQLMYSTSSVLSSNRNPIIINKAEKWPKGIYIVNFISDSFTASRKIVK